MKPRPVAVMGHTEKLYVTHYECSCGSIDGDGVSFRFSNSGDWVISLAELEAIVAEAKADRAANSKRARGDS